MCDVKEETTLFDVYKSIFDLGKGNILVKLKDDEIYVYEEIVCSQSEILARMLSDKTLNLEQHMTDIAKQFFTYLYTHVYTFSDGISIWLGILDMIELYTPDLTKKFSAEISGKINEQTMYELLIECKKRKLLDNHPIYSRIRYYVFNKFFEAIKEFHKMNWRLLYDCFDIMKPGEMIEINKDGKTDITVLRSIEQKYHVCCEHKNNGDIYLRETDESLKHDDKYVCKVYTITHREIPSDDKTEKSLCCRHRKKNLLIENFMKQSKEIQSAVFDILL